MIGTPGRLRDLIESNELRLSDVSFVVSNRPSFNHVFFT